jgi:hypothetical protein
VRLLALGVRSCLPPLSVPGLSGEFSFAFVTFFWKWYGHAITVFVFFLGFFFYIYSNGAAPCDFNAIFFGSPGMISASCSLIT